ncbi:MAG: prolipoprotein diacylglyceryl transferase [Clostridia bacterium]
MLLNPGIEIFDGFVIYYYAIIIVTGMIFAMWLMTVLLKHQGKSPDDMYTYVIVLLPIAMLSARLYTFIFPHEGEIVDWSRFFMFRDGGIAIYGGVIGGLLSVITVSLIKKQNTIDIIDTIVPGLIAAQAIGRWGNFVNQEAYGQLVTDPKLQWFPMSVFIDDKNAWFQATFFYESVWNLIGFAIMMLLIFKWKYVKRGLATFFYFIWYGIGRLWIEALRSDSLYFVFFGYKTDIKVSQLVSIIGIIGGLIGMIIVYRQEIKKFIFKIKNPKT